MAGLLKTSDYNCRIGNFQFHARLLTRTFKSIVSKSKELFAVRFSSFQWNNEKKNSKFMHFIRNRRHTKNSSSSFCLLLFINNYYHGPLVRKETERKHCFQFRLESDKKNVMLLHCSEHWIIVLHITFRITVAIFREFKVEYNPGQFKANHGLEQR